MTTSLALFWWRVSLHSLCRAGKGALLCGAGPLMMMCMMGGIAWACDAPETGYRPVLAVSSYGEIRSEDGQILRLAGLIGVRSRKDMRPERLTYELEGILSGSTIASAYAGKTEDRWKRLSAQIFVLVGTEPPPLWLQADLVERGLAMAWPEKVAGPCWDALLAAEDHARKAQLGVWSPLLRRANRFRVKHFGEGVIPSRIVYEGLVRSVREGRTVSFINFATSRGSSPGFMIQTRKIEEWRRAGRDPATFAGKRLRLRGMVSHGRFLRLDVSGPMAVEVLE